MRNLKRALSLALASVMLVGMMVVGTSAAYADVDKNDNVEAIEVLKAVGIMVGDENGNFNPENLVTRQEMAVVMSNLMDYRVASYKGTCPFGDVADWAEPYVAACYTNGITSGMGANYYGATEYVTTAQAALMLQKALGYFQFQSDFEGDWQLATVKQANKIELFDGVESGVKEAMTRNDLAQLVLNTLESGLVEASDDTIKVTTDSASVEAGKVTYNYVTSSKAYAYAISKLIPTSSTNATVGAIVELGEKLYDGDLKKYANTMDDMGRPADEWVYKTTNVGVFAKDTAAVYTAKMSKDALYDLVGKNVADNYGVIWHLDGVLQNSLDNDNDIILNTLKGMGQVLANSTSAAFNSGNGVVSEVYIDADAELVYIVTINTYLMQATADYNESKESVAVTTITGAATDANLLAEDFELVAELAEDDYILYTIDLDDNSIQTAVKAELVTGTVDAYSVSEWVTIDGTKYKHNKWIEGAENDPETGSAAATFVVTDTAAIVVDEYGYMMYVDDASLSVGNYVYVKTVAPETSLSTDVIADAYFADGTNETITLKPGTYLANTGSRTPVGEWCSYTKNSKGEYTLTVANTDDDSDATAIKNNKVVIFDSVVGNKNTIFVVVDKNDKITTYTGIANVPDVAISRDGEIGYFLDKDTAGKAAAVVFIDAGSTGTVKDNSTETLIYVLKNDSTYVDTQDNETVYTKIVLKDGVETKLDTKQNWAVGALYENYLIDEDGYYEAEDLFQDSTDADEVTVDLSAATIKHSGNNLTIGGTTVVTTADTEIHLIMIPNGSSDLKNEIMTDNAAKYETVLNMTAKTLAAKFDGYTVDGTAYIVYDDVAESDLATIIYVGIEAAN